MPGQEAPAYLEDSRFRLEVTDFDGNYVCTLPYRDLQGEWKMGMDGENIRFIVPYRANPWLTPELLEPGKHMIFLYDRLMVTPTQTSAIRFGGPLWDVTASSKEGTLNCSASGLLSLYKKRLLKANKTYTGKPEAAIQDLLAYTNTIKRMYGISVLGVIAQASATNLSSVAYLATKQGVIHDLVSEICNMGGGVDLFVKWTGNDLTAAATVQLYGGRIIPAGATIHLEHGGASSKGVLPLLDNYALTKTAQPISNSANVITQTFVAGVSVDAVAQAANDQLYETSEQNVVGITTQADVNARAALNVKKAPYKVDIPQLTLKGLDPFINFTYGDKAQVVIDDGWATYDKIVRIVGWQSSIGRHGQMTNTIFTNDLSEVT